MGYLAGWSPEDVMGWMFENPDAAGEEEQESNLLTLLKSASSPQRAAMHVLNTIWSHQQALFPHLRNLRHA